MSAEPGAAADEIGAVPLEYDRVPADAAHQMCGEEPAERAADDERALFGHSSDRAHRA
jgi:hypothetical protein